MIMMKKTTTARHMVAQSARMPIERDNETAGVEALPELNKE